MLEGNYSARNLSWKRSGQHARPQSTRILRSRERSSGNVNSNVSERSSPLKSILKSNRSGLRSLHRSRIKFAPRICSKMVISNIEWSRFALNRLLKPQSQDSELTFQEQFWKACQGNDIHFLRKHESYLWDQRVRERLTLN